ncbi:type VII secretion protein EccCa [Nonomuraea rhizosphaerae]|uniref:type VII secretion protein EccCa n=1 Tax=Nonomuraea rhizosphaerae TaxID=2665663 RepID=UPI0027E2E784|nr:type VII secretion protein EccCa [Nonomuraea rhizosphaerae]
MSGNTVVVRRPERRRPPEQPSGEVLLEPPPEIPETIPGGGLTQVLTYLPMLAGAGAMALMFTGGGTGNPIMMVSSGLFAISMVGMTLGQMFRNTGERKGRINGQRRDYYRYLEQVRKRVRRAAEQQRKAMTWNHPDPVTLWSLVMTSRLWERRPRDDDFAQVRIATSAQRLALPLIPPESKPIEDLDPMSAGALRRFVRTHATVPGLPVALALHSFARITLTGDPDAARGLARAALAQAVALHSPEDLRVSVCAGQERAAEWEWVKWLPHAFHPDEEDGAGPVRLVSRDLGELDNLLGFELKDRPRFSRGLSQDALPYHLVILDGGRVPPGSQLATDAIEGVTVIDLSGSAGQVPAQLSLHLEVTPEEVVRVVEDEMGKPVLTPLGRPDQLGLPAFAALARQLAPLRASVAGGGEEQGDALSANTTLTDLLRIGDARRLTPAQTWQPRPVRNRLRVPLGLGADGRPVELDIKEAAQGGMGPHGLVVGATGSGKSELLRTLVLAMAITHSSEVLNFVLVDFKGGATFLGLDTLPHVSAVITNLEDELPLVDRMHDALHGELVRRQELLRAAGNYASLRDYEHAREQGARLSPLPTLFIVLDEFSELLSAKPEFIELFVMIGRLGRSLGVHLLLASQRLESGRLRGLDTHLSYRIGLRTFSAAESRAVLGVADAYSLPPEPGNAYLMFETTGMTRFKAAYVSGPYQVPQRENRAAAVRQGHRGKIVWYGTERVPLPPPPPAEPEPAPKDKEQQDSLLNIVVDRLSGKGPAAHRIWLPPLKEPASLDQLLPPVRTTATHGLTAAGTDGQRPGRLHAVVGIVDSPFDQRRDPYWLDLSGAAGNAAIVGSPQTGKSTLLRTLIASIALTHTPREAQFYCLDFGGGTLSALAGLPHVGGVATRLDANRVRRTVAEVTALLARRERLFVERGIDSIATYRRQVAAGEYEGDGWGDVFVVVDGWATMRQEFETLEGPIGELVSRGLGFGIHVVGTANKWSEFRSNVRDMFATRLELRLGDAFESEIDRKAAANVPEGAPGRGLTREALHFLAALPRADGRSTVDDLTEGVAALVRAAADAWHEQPAPPVRLLPDRFPVHTLPGPGESGPRIPIGIDEAALAPVSLDFDADAHFVVLGDTESGKTNLLRVVTEGIVARFTPMEARIIIIDYRRSLLDTADNEHRIGYAASSTAAATVLKGVHQVMQTRLPPPDLTSEQLRTRSWWTGQDLYVVVDDYDLVATSSNPLSVLGDLLPQARDIGLHLILARAMGGAGRSLIDPVVRRLKEMNSPAVMLSGPREEGALFGNVRPQQLPPGRGIYVDRRSGSRLIQTAYLTPPGE